MKKVILYWLLLLCSLNVLAEKRVIKGVVLGADGTILPGAVVMEKGTENGVFTDFDGKFKIEIANKNSKVIEVIYIGFQTQEVTFDEKEEFYTITLLEIPSEEVIITYGGFELNRPRRGCAGNRISIENLVVGESIQSCRVTETPAVGVTVNDPDKKNKRKNKQAQKKKERNQRSKTI
ncbi:carboxypeptidase-like regulatory domain-containing protein [Myroides sp. DW712]|uniref:carboxypeptidase-like regulatory domain-containing protein n=1 Tax=Myroides sp. DW712 TaxID=3389800 RepID=UPI00397D6DA8